jgi:hypothetical protein
MAAARAQHAAMPAPGPAPSLRRLVLLFLAAFAASRIAFAAVGLGYCTEHVASIMHFPELDLLRDRLGETLWWLHGQPPLPSLVLGLALQLGVERGIALLAALSHLLAAAGGAALLVVLVRARVRAAAAFAVALAFVLLPGVLVYEHYAFTTLPVLALLLLACVPLQQAALHGRPRDWAVFFLLCALVVNVRNVFHLVWWGAALLAAVRVSPGRRRGVLLAGLLPALVAIAPYAKNVVVHGRCEASSWLGFGLARKTWHQEPLDARRERVARGELPPIAGVPVFGSVAEFAAVLGMPAPTGVPLLDRPQKAGGHPNYHHAIYATASAAMAQQALRWIAAHPAAYAANVQRTLGQVFAAAADWGPVATPRRQLDRYGELVDVALHGRWAGTGWNVWACLAAVTTLVGGAFGLRALWRPTRAQPTDVVLAFALGTFAYVVALVALLDTNEVMRSRLKVDGLLVLAAVLTVRRCLRERPPARPLP